jgi:hypothetical protein
MSDVQKYFSKFLPKQELSLAKTLLGQIEQEDYFLELIISIHETNINVKELSNFLNLIYRLDGLMSKDGYNQYTHNYEAQIKLNDIRIGSRHFVFQAVLESIDAERLALIWLVVKYLGTIFVSGASAVLIFYKALNQREEYLEKKDRRLLRKNIRELIEEEVELTKLPKKHKAKLVDAIDGLYFKNRKLLPSASRFMKNSVKEILLKTKKK